MKKWHKFYTRDHTLISLECDIVNSCPHCNKPNTPDTIHTHFQGEPEIDAIDNKVIFTLNCTSCFKFYVLDYQLSRVKNLMFQGIKTPYSYRALPTIDLPEELNFISENFYIIYEQATVAESEKLDQIAGIGYRKALEFLIKDFLISVFPDEEEKIKNEALGKSINRIESTSIKNLAKAATWIGNDETHYVRKHTDKDITDMKIFIRAAAQFIASEYIALKAAEFIGSN